MAMLTQPNRSAHSAISSAVTYRSAMDVPASAGLRMSNRMANNMMVVPFETRAGWAVSGLAGPGRGFRDVGPQIHRTHDPGGRRLRLGGPDGDVVAGRLRPQRADRAVLPSTEHREWVVGEVPHGVEVGHPVDVVVTDAL